MNFSFLYLPPWFPAHRHLNKGIYQFTFPIVDQMYSKQLIWVLKDYFRLRRSQGCQLNKITVFYLSNSAANEIGKQN